MKKLFLLTILIVIFSCKENKTEFIQSKVVSHIVLLKNPPIQDSIIKNLIKDFLLNNPKIYLNKKHIGFYQYTKNWDPLHKGTSYFNDHLSDPGGFSSEELSNYPEDELAAFIISKCEKDTTKLVGELIYYGLEGSEGTKREIDTLIYKCN